MIATLRGKALLKFKDAVMLDVRGVGYRVRMPTPFLAEVELGKELFCHTHLAIREKEWNIFGFKTRSDMELFELLITVQRVGPRVGLAALSAMEAHVLAGAIKSEQANLLTRIPGVGKRTAQRIILDLKDKVGAYATGMVATVPRDDADAISALTALGYSQAEARDALKKVPSNLGLEEKIFAALQRLSG